jgi:hypothetical protein
MIVIELCASIALIRADTVQNRLPKAGPRMIGNIPSFPSYLLLRSQAFLLTRGVSLRRLFSQQIMASTNPLAPTTDKEPMLESEEQTQLEEVC